MGGALAAQGMGQVGLTLTLSHPDLCTPKPMGLSAPHLHTQNSTLTS